MDLHPLGLRSNENFISNLEAYLVLLSRWNRVTNLSGIKKTERYGACPPTGLTIGSRLHRGKDYFRCWKRCRPAWHIYMILYSKKSFYPVRLEWQENKIYDKL